MKPDWKDAPEWAQWLAQDADGSWFWFQYEPRLEPVRQIWQEFSDDGDILKTTVTPSKEPRP